MITKPYKIINEHKVFNLNQNEEDYKFCGFEELFNNEEQYFWFRARKDFICKMMTKYIPKESKIIEIGAGTGNVTKHLLANGYQNISVGEMHLDALDYAKSYGIAERFCFNVLEVPFSDEFDCVCAFDVIEHIDDDLCALQNIAKSLKTNANGGGGAIVL